MVVMFSTSHALAQTKLVNPAIGRRSESREEAGRSARPRVAALSAGYSPDANPISVANPSADSGSHSGVTTATERAAIDAYSNPGRNLRVSLVADF